MEISVVLPVTRIDTAGNCVRSLENQDFDLKWQLVVICSPGLEREVISLCRNLNTLLITEEDRNPALRRNMAWQAASGDIIGFIDDDVECSSRWIRTAYEFFSSFPDAAVAGGPDLLPAVAGLGERISDILLKTPFIGSGVLAHREPVSDRKIVSPSQLALCNLFIKKRLLSELDGFNAGLGYIGEDTEFLYRAVKKAGARIFYRADMIVYHRRRKFPAGYIRQRFAYRLKNGILMFAYPEIYLANIRILSFLLLVTLTISAAVCCPRFLFYAAVAYILLVVSLTFREWSRHPLLVAVLPAAFFIHHAAYYLGLLAGIVYGALNLRAARRMRR